MSATVTLPSMENALMPLMAEQCQGRQNGISICISDTSKAVAYCHCQPSIAMADLARMQVLADHEPLS